MYMEITFGSTDIGKLMMLIRFNDTNAVLASSTWSGVIAMNKANEAAANYE